MLISIASLISAAFLLDVIILVLTIVGLVRQRAARSTKLWKSLYRQGVVYFVATAIINLPTLVCDISLPRLGKLINVSLAVLCMERTEW